MEEELAQLRELRRRDARRDAHEAEMRRCVRPTGGERAAELDVQRAAGEMQRLRCLDPHAASATTERREQLAGLRSRLHNVQAADAARRTMGGGESFGDPRPSQHDMT
jgi:hypothetical protein